MTGFKQIDSKLIFVIKTYGEQHTLMDTMYVITEKNHTCLEVLKGFVHFHKITPRKESVKTGHDEDGRVFAIATYYSLGQRCTIEVRKGFQSHDLSIVTF